MKIYLASSWRNLMQPLTLELLRSCGHEVYDFRNPAGRTGFAWSEIDEHWQAWDADRFVEQLDHPKAVAGFNSDFEAMRWCDVGVLLMPCGRSAHLELGWLAGAGKRTVILVSHVVYQEPELMYKLADQVVTSGGHLVAVLNRWQSVEFSRRSAS